MNAIPKELSIHKYDKCNISFVTMYTGTIALSQDAESLPKEHQSSGEMSPMETDFLKFRNETLF